LVTGAIGERLKGVQLEALHELLVEVHRMSDSGERKRKGR